VVRMERRVSGVGLQGGEKGPLECWRMYSTQEDDTNEEMQMMPECMLIYEM
jgi:hypothetical protein